jgi:serine/threonine protein kinase
VDAKDDMKPHLFDNRYEYVKDIGSGGFGRVFLAREEITNRYVAIKQLKETDKVHQKGIVKELKVISKFNHPQIVTLYNYFFQDDQLFLVMEYCGGGNLRSVVRDSNVTPSKVIQWIHDLALTLQLVHNKGIIHHDVKPDNILISDDGQIKLSDFGIANSRAGTTAYMSPEALRWDQSSTSDPRVDVYALGVTLMELLVGNHPFVGLSSEEIIDLHERSEFPIRGLPSWQQEIILKSINKVPELRFQSMKDFAEAIQAKHVPFIVHTENIEAGRLAENVNKMLKNKKWVKAKSFLEFGLEQYPDNVGILHMSGKFSLLQQRLTEAKSMYERALSFNSRLNVQKDLGWLNLALKNYPQAISLLSDHIHRNPTDYEAYNLLLQCFYETDRYEAGIELSKAILEVEPSIECFQNNYYLCCTMHKMHHPSFQFIEPKSRNNAFLDYNFWLMYEDRATHGKLNQPTLKSKLLFMDYRFNKRPAGKLYFTETNVANGKVGETNKEIITFGREGYNVNNVEVPGGAEISRRHCLIVNCKDDIWLYDLNSTGTFLNGIKVIGRMPLTDLNVIRIDKAEYKITTDRSKLF